MASGYMPVVKSAYQNEAYVGWLAENSTQAKSTKVSVEQEANYFTSPSFVGSSNARTEVGSLVTSVLTGQKTLDKAFEDAIVKCNG